MADEGINAITVQEIKKISLRSQANRSRFTGKDRLIKQDKQQRLWLDKDDFHAGRA